jgi:hypothetical protein
MAARQEISEERFKRVEPMKGAIKLVKGLVSVYSASRRGDGSEESS